MITRRKLLGLLPIAALAGALKTKDAEPGFTDGGFYRPALPGGLRFQAHRGERVEIGGLFEGGAREDRPHWPPVIPVKFYSNGGADSSKMKVTLVNGADISHRIGSRYAVQFAAAELMDEIPVYLWDDPHRIDEERHELAGLNVRLRLVSIVTAPNYDPKPQDLEVVVTASAATDGWERIRDNINRLLIDNYKNGSYTSR